MSKSYRRAGTLAIPWRHAGVALAVTVIGRAQAERHHGDRRAGAMRGAAHRSRLSADCSALPNDAPHRTRRVRMNFNRDADQVSHTKCYEFPNAGGVSREVDPNRAVVEVLLRRARIRREPHRDRNRSRISSGRVGNATPTGVFTIIEKRRFHQSNIYSNAPMPFMQRITYSGIALHEGVLPGCPASHGWIRLPGDFAARLFALSSVGARVIVARDALEPRPIMHPRLFSYRPPPAETVQDAVLPEDEILISRFAAAAVAGGMRVRTADASGMAVSRSDAARAQRLARQRASPVSIFISRREGRLFARQPCNRCWSRPSVSIMATAPWGCTSSRHWAWTMTARRCAGMSYR